MIMVQIFNLPLPECHSLFNGTVLCVYIGVYSICLGPLDICHDLEYARLKDACLLECNRYQTQTIYQGLYLFYTFGHRSFTR